MSISINSPPPAQPSPEPSQNSSSPQENETVTAPAVEASNPPQENNSSPAPAADITQPGLPDKATFETSPLVNTEDSTTPTGFTELTPVNVNDLPPEEQGYVQASWDATLYDVEGTYGNVIRDAADDTQTTEAISSESTPQNTAPSDNIANTSDASTAPITIPSGVNVYSYVTTDGTTQYLFEVSSEATLAEEDTASLYVTSTPQGETHLLTDMDGTESVPTVDTWASVNAIRMNGETFSEVTTDDGQTIIQALDANGNPVPTEFDSILDASTTMEAYRTIGVPPGEGVDFHTTVQQWEESTGESYWDHPTVPYVQNEDRTYTNVLQQRLDLYSIQSQYQPTHLIMAEDQMLLDVDPVTATPEEIMGVMNWYNNTSQGLSLGFGFDENPITIDFRRPDEIWNEDQNLYVSSTGEYSPVVYEFGNLDETESGLSDRPIHIMVNDRWVRGEPVYNDDGTITIPFTDDYDTYELVFQNPGDISFIQEGADANRDASFQNSGRSGLYVSNRINMATNGSGFESIQTYDYENDQMTTYIPRSEGNGYEPVTIDRYQLPLQEQTDQSGTATLVPSNQVEMAQWFLNDAEDVMLQTAIEAAATNPEHYGHLLTQGEAEEWALSDVASSMGDPFAYQLLVRGALASNLGETSSEEGGFQQLSADMIDSVANLGLSWNTDPQVASAALNGEVQRAIEDNFVAQTFASEENGALQFDQTAYTNYLAAALQPTEPFTHPLQQKIIIEMGQEQQTLAILSNPDQMRTVGNDELYQQWLSEISTEWVAQTGTPFPSEQFVTSLNGEFPMVAVPYTNPLTQETISIYAPDITVSGNTNGEVNQALLNIWLGTVASATADDAFVANATAFTAAQKTATLAWAEELNSRALELDANMGIGGDASRGLDQLLNLIPVIQDEITTPEELVEMFNNGVQDGNYTYGGVAKIATAYNQMLQYSGQDYYDAEGNLVAGTGDLDRNSYAEAAMQFMLARQETDNIATNGLGSVDIHLSQR